MKKIPPRLAYGQSDGVISPTRSLFPSRQQNNKNPNQNKNQNIIPKASIGKTNQPTNKQPPQINKSHHHHHQKTQTKKTKPNQNPNTTKTTDKQHREEAKEVGRGQPAWEEEIQGLVIFESQDYEKYCMSLVM